MPTLASRPRLLSASNVDEHPPAVSQPARQPSEPALAGWGGTALVATAVTLLNWPGWLQIRPGLDSSWQAGLAVAFTRHLQWGPQLDFTYGPYGFAGFLEPFYRATASIAFCYVFAVTWLLAYLLVAALRPFWPGTDGTSRYSASWYWPSRYWPSRYWPSRYWGLAISAVIVWALIWVSWAEARAADFVCVTGLGLALYMLEARTPAVRAVLAALLGALAGFAVLVKLNSGIILVALLILALTGATMMSRERWRATGLAVAAFVGMFAVAWVSAGQSFRNLPNFARASASLLFGYGTAMAEDLKRPSIAWLAITIVLVVGAVYAATVWRRGRKERLVALLMLAVWGWAEVKEGFVAGNHFPLFFRVMLVAVALSALLRPTRALYAGGLALATSVTLAATSLPGLDPLASIRSVGTNLADVVQPGRFAHLVVSSRSELRRAEPLPAAALSMLRGQSAAIEPWEDMVAWADPQLRWDPEPVVQSYSAFTSDLDRRDAAFLGSDRAPQRILVRRLRSGFDDRDLFMDPPAATVAIYCHYAQLALAGPWQVLQRVPDRCGPAVIIGRADARFGQSVDVPNSPGRMVVASFVLSTPLLARLEEGVLKPPDTYLVAWEGQSNPLTYRFVTGTAVDNHVLSVPVSLGYSAAFVPPSIHKLEISGGGWKAGQGSVEIVFRALSLAR